MKTPEIFWSFLVLKNPRAAEQRARGRRTTGVSLLSDGGEVPDLPRLLGAAELGFSTQGGTGYR